MGTVQWCTMIVKKKGVLGPLLLLLLSIPSISCDHCRPHHDDYDAGKCFGSTIAIVFGVVGSICLLAAALLDVNLRLVGMMMMTTRLLKILRMENWWEGLK